jgi:hypothetical protein
MDTLIEVQIYLDCTDEAVIYHLERRISLRSQDLTIKIIPNAMCKMAFYVDSYKQLHRIKELINCYGIEFNHLKTEEVEVSIHR